MHSYLYSVPALGGENAFIMSPLACIHPPSDISIYSHHTRTACPHSLVFIQDNTFVGIIILDYLMPVHVMIWTLSQCAILLGTAKRSMCTLESISMSASGHLTMPFFVNRTVPWNRGEIICIMLCNLCDSKMSLNR